MYYLKMITRCLGFCTTGVICLIATSSVIFAQPGIKELPVVSKPKQRPATDRVIIRNVPLQPTKGTLAVVLNYKVNATVVVKDIQGKLVAKAEADEDGQAEFQLRRGRVYQVEVNYPSYIGFNDKTKALGATEIVRAKLTPQFGTLRFKLLPQNSQVFIDNELR